MAGGTVKLDRAQILSHRLRVGELGDRLPPGASSIRRAASAGLQDSMPRAAVLSLHARVTGVAPDGWSDPALVQVWGPRYSAYAVAADEVAAFTLGRLPTDEAGRRRAVYIADRLEEFLDGRAMTYREAGKGLGINPNGLRYAAPTGRVLLRWEGSGQPVVWTVERPEMSELDAKQDLVRRYLHVLGPGTPATFAKWAGVTPRAARATFDAMAGEMVAVETPIGSASMLDTDIDAVSRTDAAPRPTRLLPSGDAFSLFWGSDREVLVPDRRQRDELWTPRVWPGALLVDGEIIGTWRRAGAVVDLSPWHRLTAAQRSVVESEVAQLPVSDGDMQARWTTP